MVALTSFGSRLRIGLFPRFILTDSLLGFSLADIWLNDNSGIRAIIDSAMVS